MNTNSIARRMGAFVGIAAVAVATLIAAPAAHAGTLRWSGNVDDTATIYLSGRDVRTVASAKGVSNERNAVRGNLPMAPGRVWLSKESGRGNVEVIQQPNARNHYTAAIRVHDASAGSGRYTFTLQWPNQNNRRAYHANPVHRMR